jgi:hypothetical protein
MAHMNAKLNPLHPRFGNLGLILRDRLPLPHSAAAVRTPRGERDLHDFVDVLGKRTAASPAILLARLAPRLLRMSLGLSPGEWSGLALGGPQRLFQSAAQTFHFGLQLLILPPEPGDLFRQMRFPCHAPD